MPKNFPGNKRWMNVGFDNYVDINRIQMILVYPDTRPTSPVWRLLQGWREKGLAVDLTKGRKKRTLVVLDTGMVLEVTLWQRHLLHRLGLVQQGADFQG